MVNRFQHTPRTADEYVSELTRQLCRHLPREKADQIAGEAQAHLADRVGDLMGEGVSRPEAEAVAIAGFGPAQHYTRAAVENAYSDSTARKYQYVGRLALAGLCVGALLPLLLQTPLRTVVAGVTLDFSTVETGLALLIPLCSLAARQPQTRAYAASLLALVTVTFMVSGLWYVPYPNTPPVLLANSNYRQIAYHSGIGHPRGDYSARIDDLRHHPVYEEIALLKQGIPVYASDAPVPASLRSQGGYIVPKDEGWYWCMGSTNVLAFQEWPSHSYTSWFALPPAVQALPYRTVATREEAARIWQTTGSHWLTAKQSVRECVEDTRQVLERVSHAGWGFNTGAATYQASGQLFALPILLLMDLVLAHLGRAMWIFLRNHRRPVRTAQ